MLGFSPISSSPIASSNGTFLLTCIVPSVALQSSTPSIGVSSPSSVSLKISNAEAYSSSAINVLSPQIILSLPNCIINASAVLTGSVPVVSLSPISANYSAGMVNNVTVSSVTLTPFSAGLSISSSALGVVGQIGMSKADGIPISSAARTGTLIPVALTGVIGSINASSNPIAGINSINIILPSTIVSATSNVTAGLASINFGAMGIAHTFTYFIRSSSYILLGSRTTEVKLFSRGKFI